MSLCKNPFMVQGIPAGCGQCMPCRINRQRTWTHRMMLESMKHAENSFLTLTYDNDHLPKDMSLVPADPQNWLKRFRKAIYPHKIRYYLVGEYGDQSQRPHYHAALFGVGPSYADIVQSTWGMGHIMLAEFNLHTAQYICGYVTKKMTSKDDPRLDGRYPEFARMSLRPGIGASAMADVADVLFTDHGANEVLSTGDVPRSLQHGGRKLPLGRYLTQKLRDEIGMPDEFKKAKTATYNQEMQDMWKVAQNDPKLTKEEKLTIKSVLKRKNVQKHRNIEAKFNLYKPEKKL